jgi:hypothetical protein
MRIKDYKSLLSGDCGWSGSRHESQERIVVPLLVPESMENVLTYMMSEQNWAVIT